MRLWNWFLTKLGKRFPLPPRHILNYEEIKKYWDSMGLKWQGQCSVIVLRVRKRVPGDTRPNIWTGNTLLTQHQIYDMLSLEERRKGCEDGRLDPFTIRIDREWEVVPGIKRKEEVCIANFEL